MPTDRWTEPARRRLLALRGPDGAWAYRLGGTAATEPTALAALALRASAPADDPDAAPALRAAGDWLAARQRPDGSVGVSAARPAPGWATPHALLAWSAAGAYPDRVRAAAGWLLAHKGRALPRADDPGRVAGHDTTLVGWPWVDDTHSWVEPTALAVLALGRAGLANHPRVAEGLRLIRDRAVASGGWNYGNKSVFGRDLRAQPAPTGIALLALAGGDPWAGVAEGAAGYLVRALPGVRAPSSLGWGLLGLRAWGVRPEGADAWLDESYRAAADSPDAAPRLAALLLAAGVGALALFGRAAAADRKGDLG